MEYSAAGKSLLADAGYQQYEVSAYAQSKKHCQHNLNYWLFGDYLGIGAGAHSKLTFPAHAAITRIAKHKHPRRYMENSGSDHRIQERVDVDRSSTYLEFLMNALRLNDGFSRADFLQRTGESVAVIMSELREAEAMGLLANTPDTFKPTDKGLQYLNSLLSLFLDAGPENDAPQQKVIPITPAGPS